MKSMTRLFAAIVLLCGVAGQASADDPQSGKPRTWSVNCHTGQSITHTLPHAAPGDTIMVSGTCRERVLITQPVILNGRGSAVLDGAGLPPGPATLPELDGVIIIEGATGVSIAGLTVRNGRSNGIVATRGAAVMLTDVTTESNTLMGISVSDNSIVEAIDSATRSNGVSGFDVFTSSSLILRGTFAASDNSSSGGEINGQSIVELRGAQVTIANNAAFGIIAGSQSQLAVFGFDVAMGSTLNVSGSGVAGIGLAGHSSATLFSDTVITVENNGVGILVAAGSSLDSPPFSASRILLHSNGVGMNVFAGSKVFLYAGLDVQDNGTGVRLRERSWLNTRAAADPGSGRTDEAADSDRLAPLRKVLHARVRHRTTYSRRAPVDRGSDSRRFAGIVSGATRAGS
jgi:hypothetical protein